MKDKNKKLIPSGDNLLAIFEALANPHRLRILAMLTTERNYVSQLARDLKISRPLLYMHLQRLENAGLIETKLELSADGKAVKYVEARQFQLDLNLEMIAASVKTLSTKKAKKTDSEAKKGGAE
jgi:predicted transcriptional regulator